MPNLYVQATALHDVAGRVDYISSEHRQERLLASYDAAADLLDGQFWKQLAKESRDAFEQFSSKTRSTYTDKDGNEKQMKCVQGRETMIQLSNSLLERMSPEEICRTIADEYREKLGLTVAVGLHLKRKSDSPDNLHAHVVFPERELRKIPEIKIAERALFFDAAGKRRYKKSEILDENKQLLPGCKIIKKGEIYEQRYFSSVNPEYSSKEWMKHVKSDVILPLRNGKLKGDVEITEYSAETGKLPQQHIGNKPQGEIPGKIKAYNNSVKEYNAIIDSRDVPRNASQHIQIQMKAAKKKNQTLENWITKLDKLLRNLDFLNKERQAWYEVGEVAGVDKVEIDKFFEQRDKPWSEKEAAWNSYRDTQEKFWQEFNNFKGALQKELNEAYKERQKVKAAYWMADPRNRNKSLIGVIFAGIVIARHNSLSAIDREIEQLKRAKADLYNDVAAFKESAGTVRGLLKRQDIRLDGYVDALKALQKKADRMYQQAAEEQKKAGYSFVDDLVKRADTRKKAEKQQAGQKYGKKNNKDLVESKAIQDYKEGLKQKMRAELKKDDGSR